MLFKLQDYLQQMKIAESGKTFAVYLFDCIAMEEPTDKWSCSSITEREGVNRGMQIRRSVPFFHQVRRSANIFVQIRHRNHVQKQ